jgi:hypothetical protein
MRGLHVKERLGFCMGVEQILCDMPGLDACRERPTPVLKDAIDEVR